VLSLRSLAIDQYLATGEDPGPRQTLLTGRYACYDVYACSDSKWLSVGAIEPHFFANLCVALGLERYADRQLDDECQDEIRAAFREVFATRERDAWVAELAPKDTCVAPVYSIPELVDDRHFRARQVFSVRSVGSWRAESGPGQRSTCARTRQRTRASCCGRSE
jgi:alpha-methylacyl-CoA racemase